MSSLEQFKKENKNILDTQLAKDFSRLHRSRIGKLLKQGKKKEKWLPQV